MNTRYLHLPWRAFLLVLPLTVAVVLLVLVQSTLADPPPGDLARITLASAADRDSQDPKLSRDGSVVAFESSSDLLNQGIPSGQWEIWLYDTRTMTYTRVTSASDANRDSFDASLSGDGTVVAFDSNSDFLNQGIPSGQYEI